jgi:hypothetical protein
MTWEVPAYLAPPVPLQQYTQAIDPFQPQHGPFIPPSATFQGINYLDERSPLAPQLQASLWPANFRVSTYPKYNGSTDPAQYIMSYQVTVASSGGDDAIMDKSFIITLEGPALTWYTRLPSLSIESWKELRDKFLLNFQGYRPGTDALAKLSLYKQQEKETLRKYYRKILTLKSQVPSVDDHIAIHYAISGLRAGVLYSHCIRDPPTNPQELYQLFEKYARSEELHQHKVESHRKPKDPSQSSRTWTRPAQSDSGRDNHNHQQVHTIANEHPAGEATRRREYPLKAAAQEEEAEDGHSSSEDSIACFTVKTARIPQGIVQRLRQPRTECLELNQPTTSGRSSTLTTNNNPTTTSKFIINPTMLTSTTKRFMFYHHRLRTTQILHTTTTHRKHPNKKTSLSHHIAESST